VAADNLGMSARLVLPATAFVLVIGVVAAMRQLPPRAAAATRAAPAAEGAPASAALLFAERLDLNAATAADLAALPGIGPVRAARIVELRAQRGGFRRVEELTDVSGIGPATLARVRSKLKIR
jgi:competence protein ComEA